MLKESLKESNTVIISDAMSIYFHGQNDYQDLDMWGNSDNENIKIEYVCYVILYRKFNVF